MLVEIYLLEQLDALACYGTLSAASEALHLTQPTLTRSMQKLEHQIGVPLFDRENKKIRLNENGLMAADYAARILSLEEEMNSRIHLLERSKNTVSFGSISPGPVKELVPQLTELVSGKTISAEMASEDELISGLADNKYHFVTLSHPVTEDGLFCRKVFGERIYYCFVSTQHPVGTDGVRFKDINGRDILMPNNVGFWEKIVRENMPDSKIIVQDSNDTVNLVAENSTLPAFSSDVAIRHDIVRPDRISVPILDDAAYSDYYCVCKTTNKEMIRIIERFVGKFE